MLIVHLFVSYAFINLCHFFSSSWCRGLAAASVCGSSRTFLFTFLDGASTFFLHLFKVCSKIILKCMVLIAISENQDI